jgi:hypothetical protein
MKIYNLNILRSFFSSSFYSFLSFFVCQIERHMSRSAKLNIIKDENDKDEVIIDITPTMVTHPSAGATSTKRLQHCSLLLKIIGLVLIVGVVLLSVLLPNYLRNKNADSSSDSNTDPTNARFPEGV